MDTSTVNTVNASEALGKVQDLLKLFKKANAAAKTRLGGSAYKGALEERIAACERVIAESRINPQASMMSGSPNDLIHPTSGGNDQLNCAHGDPGPDSGGGLENDTSPSTSVYLCLPSVYLGRHTCTTTCRHMSVYLRLPPSTSGYLKWTAFGYLRLPPSTSVSVGPQKRANERETWEVPRSLDSLPRPGSVYSHLLGRQTEDSGELVIDPNLANTPPAKKARTNYGQTHRKIVLLCSVAFWGLEHGNAVEAADPTHTVAGFETLYDAAVEILDQVVHSAQQSQFSDEQFGWNIQYNGGDLKISHLISLHAWLVVNGLMDVTYASSAPKDHSDVTITHNGKRLKMTRKMLGDARMDPSMYPRCVEAGMDIIKEVLRNRNGRFKCITCDRGGAWGRAINDRPVPPKADHPYLEGCKCPLRGAALELWMVKVTAGMAGVSQSGVEDVTARRLAFNPDTLKVIAGAIEVASGHDVESLLQPEMDRLEFTIHWALGCLHSIASDDESKYTESFSLLSKKLKETMRNWMLEESDDRSE
ncbi:hypothetical protein DFH08DRAFT_941905 [Mycena albidolilacea]|uniref:Uncharacterized protein n=1 Tax=Mycena albidolilacea TaxID=1033008 RepID=A0AAD6ZG79_9AGAR|nr:hypothetical protein DFH08DRAFT_941905 [Mycena albidolilacea]